MTKRDTAAMDARRVTQINVMNIETDKQNIRADRLDEQLEELAADIQANGLLQPIGVSAIANGRFQLLFGSRRLAAHKLLRRTTIDALVMTATDEQIKAIAARENIHRREMTLEEECALVKYMGDTEGKSPDEIRAAIGKSRAWVQSRQLATNLDVDTREALFTNRISFGVAEQLAGVERMEYRMQLLQHAVNERWTRGIMVQAIEQLQYRRDIEDAVNAGVAAAGQAQAYPDVYLECAACKAKRLPRHLTTIRVCATGCEPEQETT